MVCTHIVRLGPAPALLVALLWAGCGRVDSLAVVSSSDAGGDAGTAGDAGDGGAAGRGGDAGDGGDPSDAGDGGGACALLADAGTPFGAPVLLSDPGRVSLSPSVASSGDVTVVAWHQFPPAGVAGLAQVAWRTVRAGCVEATQVAADPLPLTRWPSVAASDAGFVLAYEAGDGGGATEIHAQRLDPRGAPEGAPEALSLPGIAGRLPHVAAAGGNYGVVWMDGTQHFYALRGAGEETTAAPTGFALQYGGLVNRPQVALTSAGTLLLAWNDGFVPGDTRFEVWLAARPRGGPFGAARNVSGTSNQSSFGVSLALEDSGTLDLAWSEATPADDAVFEATFATRSAAGVFSAPARWGAQGTFVNPPSVTQGLAATWTSTAAMAGPLWFAPGRSAAQGVLAGLPVFQHQLARGTGGARHLVIADGSRPARVYYVPGL